MRPRAVRLIKLHFIYKIIGVKCLGVSKKTYPVYVHIIYKTYMTRQAISTVSPSFFVVLSHERVDRVVWVFCPDIQHSYISNPNTHI